MFPTTANGSVATNPVVVTVVEKGAGVGWGVTGTNTGWAVTGLGVTGTKTGCVTGGDVGFGVLETILVESLIQ